MTFSVFNLMKKLMVVRMVNAIDQTLIINLVIWQMQVFGELEFPSDVIVYPSKINILKPYFIQFKNSVHGPKILAQVLI